MIHPRCDVCGSVMAMDGTDLNGNIRWSCFQCDQPIYQNHCWVNGCNGQIDSRINPRSQTPGMGFHCLLCGKDLTEWKLRKGLITPTQLQSMKGNENAIAIL
jgi:hypothetical protein